MKSLQLEKSTAVKLFSKVPEWFQQTLISTFGSECFSTKITDRVKTFLDALDEKGKVMEDIYNEKDTPDEAAYKMIKFIISVINEGWEPDWNNTDQKKWYPWFRLSSGFGFSGSAYIYDFTSTLVGSRLCFESKEKCEYVANQFLDLYETFLTIK